MMEKPVSNGEMSFRLDSADFKDVIRTSHFVDKTLLIREFLNDTCKVLVTAPRRFGKSTNLMMLKRFAEIEVDIEGCPLKHISSTVIGTYNHNIFTREIHGMKLKIMEEENKNLVQEHFGRHPVIYLNLAIGTIISNKATKVYSRQEIENRFKNIIHLAYIEHRYLSFSPILRKMEQRYCKYWVSSNYFMNPRCRFEDGLKFLSIYLWKHFGEKKCWVLVDDFDAVIAEHLIDLDGPLVEEIVRKNNKLLSSVLKDNELYVERAFLTGSSQIVSVNFGGLDNITSYKFLKNHRYTPFYGLSEKEISDILVQTGKKSTLINEIAYFYKGYCTEDNSITMYDPWSVFNYLHTGEFEPWWPNTAHIKNMTELFNISHIRNIMDRLVNNEEVIIDVYNKIDIDYLIELTEQMSNPFDHHLHFANLFFNYLLEQGYLSYAKKTSEIMPYTVNIAKKKKLTSQDMEEEFREELQEKMIIKLPNKPIVQYFYKHLRSYYGTLFVFQISRNQRPKYDDMFWLLESTIKQTEQKFQEAFQSFSSKICKLLNIFSQKACFRTSDAALHSFGNFLMVSFAGEFHITHDIRIIKKQLNFVMIKESLVILFGIKYCKGDNNNESAFEALSQIEEYSSKFFSRQVTNKISNCVLIGLSVKQYKDVTLVDIKCTQDERNEQNIFEFQKSGFPTLYIYEASITRSSKQSTKKSSKRSYSKESLSAEKSSPKKLFTIESSSKESSSKESSSKESPSKESPSKESPSKESPSKESPSKESPSKESPSKESPSKESSTAEISLKKSSAESSLKESSKKSFTAESGLRSTSGSSKESLTAESPQKSFKESFSARSSLKEFSTAKSPKTETRISKSSIKESSNTKSLSKKETPKHSVTKN